MPILFRGFKNLQLFSRHCVHTMGPANFNYSSVQCRLNVSIVHDLKSALCKRYVSRCKDGPPLVAQFARLLRSEVAPFHLSGANGRTGGKRLAMEISALCMGCLNSLTHAHTLPFSLFDLAFVLINRITCFPPVGQPWPYVFIGQLCLIAMDL